jgi:hypothetical protein
MRKKNRGSSSVTTQDFFQMHAVGAQLLTRVHDHVAAGTHGWLLTWNNKQIA